MNEIPINLAVEDLISETVLRTLINRADRAYCIGAVYSHGGFGYLKNTAPGWNRAARSVPFLLLTDLDSCPCPSELMGDWLNQPRHHNFIFRIAVREVETWILADIQNFANFIGLSVAKLPQSPELLSDPKKVLVELAAKSKKKAIRTRLAPKPGSTAKQGPEYNQCLGEFVINHWNPQSASANSPSLARCIRALDTFTPIWADIDAE